MEQMLTITNAAFTSIFSPSSNSYPKANNWSERGALAGQTKGHRLYLALKSIPLMFY